MSDELQTISHAELTALKLSVEKLAEKLEQGATAINTLTVNMSGLLTSLRIIRWIVGIIATICAGAMMIFFYITVRGLDNEGVLRGLVSRTNDMRSEIDKFIRDGSDLAKQNTLEIKTSSKDLIEFRNQLLARQEAEAAVNERQNQIIQGMQFDLMSFKTRLETHLRDDSDFQSKLLPSSPN